MKKSQRITETDSEIVQVQHMPYTAQAVLENVYDRIFRPATAAILSGHDDLASRIIMSLDFAETALHDPHDKNAPEMARKITANDPNSLDMNGAVWTHEEGCSCATDPAEHDRRVLAVLELSKAAGCVEQSLFFSGAVFSLMITSDEPPVVIGSPGRGRPLGKVTKETNSVWFIRTIGHRNQFSPAESLFFAVRNEMLVDTFKQQVVHLAEEYRPFLSKQTVEMLNPFSSNGYMDEFFAPAIASAHKNS